MRLSPGDEIFFRERTRLRRPGVTRSLRRARALAGRLGIDPEAIGRDGPPVLAVVGSKGKGTAATYASAVLCAAGLRVGTLTSPGYRSNRERIRVDGRAIDATAYGALAQRIDATLAACAAELPGDGYLSPTGLFTLAAVRHFLDERCDVMVLEAGMGGISDEISLFAPGVVAVTAIFGEHLGILGDSVAGIAANKLGVIAARTAAVVTVAQPDADVGRQVASAAGDRRFVVVDGDDAGPWPPGLSGGNARLGVAAAAELLDALGQAPPEQDAQTAVLRTVRLPGRLSVHRRGGQIWVVDAAINGAGAAAARQWFESELGAPSSVLVCLPDDKDRDGVLAALQGLPVTGVRIDAAHLDFTDQAGAPLFATLDHSRLGERVLALGTISFAGEALDLLDAATEVSFVPGVLLESQ